MTAPFCELYAKNSVRHHELWRWEWHPSTFGRIQAISVQKLSWKPAGNVALCLDLLDSIRVCRVRACSPCRVQTNRRGGRDEEVDVAGGDVGDGADGCLTGHSSGRWGDRARGRERRPRSDVYGHEGG